MAHRPDTGDPAAAASAAAAELAELLRRTVAELDARGAHDEALGAVKPGRGFGPISTATKMVRAGRAWRLGVLLIDRNAELYETGSVTRAIVPLRAVTNRSAEAEARRDDRRAAARGNFPDGEVVNFDYSPIDTSAAALDEGSGILSLQEGAVMVRWHATDPARRLDSYIADRLSLLVAE
ncbi:hypothetical protein [Salinibacterium sp.]|uniref:hypothetical protein n=1 Tax=Salinibacterium sp. TaxID=1915057 RepID=UPI00286BF2BD|nr:hypothetical protein [Salinibacterium sp.]